MEFFIANEEAKKYQACWETGKWQKILIAAKIDRAQNQQRHGSKVEILLVASFNMEIIFAPKLSKQKIP